MTRLALCLALSAACAATPSAAKGPRPDDLIEVKHGELERLKASEREALATKARVVELERALAETRAALLVAEQRLGRAPFQPRSLVRADFTMKAPDALRLEARSAKAKRTSLGKAIAAQRRGAVVAFWATWCKPCTTSEELERLVHLRAELATQGADLVFFSVDEDVDVVTRDARAATWLYPLWQLDDGHLGMLGRAWVQSQGVDLPLMLVVAPDGRVSWVKKGALDDESVRDLVTAVIREGR